MKQKIIFTTLPNGLDTNQLSIAKISVAVSLQVTDLSLPDVLLVPTEVKLQSLPDMKNWIDLITQAKFTVQIDGVAVDPAKVTLTTKFQETDPVWKKIFQDSVTVRPYTPPDNTKIPILSYPVKNIVSHIETIVDKIGKAYTTDMPVAGYYTDNPLFLDISNYTVEVAKEKSFFAFATDVQNGQKIEKLFSSSRPYIPFTDSKIKPDPKTDFAQLGYFHGLYGSNKIQKDFLPFKKPDFEFHDILSILSQYPKLLRVLGLVLDLEFPAQLLAGSNKNPHYIRILPTGLPLSVPTDIVCPATAYEIKESGFYAKAAQGSFYEKGHVNINNGSFTAFQVDTDGAALKLTSHIDALQLKKVTKINGSYDDSDLEQAYYHNEEVARREGLPSFRTAGIALAKNGMAEYLYGRFVQSNSLKSAMSAVIQVPGNLPGSIVTYYAGAKDPATGNELLLTADDINIGYRMDIKSLDKKTWLAGQWRSLHAHKNKYFFVNTQNQQVPIPDPGDDEGFIQLSTSEDNAISGKHMKVSEVIARWEGWSLSVPMPGLSMNEHTLSDPKDFKVVENNVGNEGRKYETPNDVKFRLNVIPVPAKGTLPRLRFGMPYQIRLRMVDMAGNSLPVELEPEKREDAVLPLLAYRRYEPVDAPFLVPGHVFKDGESSEVMVIRSNEGQSVKEYESNPLRKDASGNFPYGAESVRYAKPPRTTVGMAITHGMLDQAIGQGSADMDTVYADLLAKDREVAAIPGNNDIKYNDKNLAEIPKTSPPSYEIPIDYLTDPMAAGVSIYVSALDPTSNYKLLDGKVFSKRISFYSDADIKDDFEANTPLDYKIWMAPKTFRILLVEGDKFDCVWSHDLERKFTVYLPKGHILKLNYACYWRPSDIMPNSGILEMMKMRDLEDSAGIGKKIAQGQHWMFSPYRTLTFVHAVQQPVSMPTPRSGPLPLIRRMNTSRDPADTSAALNIDLEVHGPSTGIVDIEGSWTDWEDDVNDLGHNGVQQVKKTAKVFHFTTAYSKDGYLFGDYLGQNIYSRTAQPRHQFNDTRHRYVDYKAIASTRYKEYFFRLIDENKLKPGAFNITRESPVMPKVNVLSSARPQAPQIAYVIPVFEWGKEIVDGTIIKGRSSGLRVYLKRPWYSSGEGEKLAVVLFPSNFIQGGNLYGDPTENIKKICTTWGMDPVKITPKAGNIYPSKEYFLNVKNDNDNLYAVDDLSVAEFNDTKVSIAAYDVQYDTERQLYYADIMIVIGAAYFPFIRLALAAYQQYSVRGKDGTDYCLSKIVHADYIQIPTARATTLKTAGSQVTVGISGVLPPIKTAAGYQSLIVVDFLVEPVEVQDSEQVAITIDNRQIDSYSKTILPTDINPNFTFGFTHTFDLPAEYLVKPYRVKIIEYEMTESYYVSTGNPWSNKRMVFADVHQVGLISPLRAYTAKGSPYIVYQDGAGRLQHLSAGGPVLHNDLSTLANAPLAAAAPFPFMSDAETVQHIVYRGADRNVYEVWRAESGWYLNNLTSPATFVKAAGNPAGYITGNVKHVVYRDENGHIQELWAGNAWNQGNVTLKAGVAPGELAAGDPSGYASHNDTIQRIVYRSRNGHIHELWAGGVWSHADLCVIANVPPDGLASGDPFGYTTDGSLLMRVIYIGRDGHIHELYAGNTWAHGNLTQSAGVTDLSLPAGKPSVYVTDNTKVPHIVYRGRDGHIHELWVANSKWNHGNLTQVANAPFAAGDPVGYVSLKGIVQVQNVAYAGVNGHLYKLSTSIATPWQVQDLGYLPDSAPVLRKWKLSINGYQSDLVIEWIDENGNIRGRIINGTQETAISGMWSRSARKLIFSRQFIATDPTTTQVYTGYLMQGDTQLAGTFEAFTGSSANARLNTFGWTAWIA